MFDKFKEECALMGVWMHAEAANLAYLGMYAQQHRGQEGAGVVAMEPSNSVFTGHKGIGLVADVFQNFDFSQLPGSCALGHVRYTTAGGHGLANVQPFYAEIASGEAAIAHNGNLTNVERLRAKLIQEGAIFSTNSDTEVIQHLLARSSRDVPRVETVIGALKQVEGAYSLLVMYDDRIFAIRDPKGFRPLCVGKLEDAWVFASETCAFDLIGAEYQRDIEPGEIFEVSITGSTQSYFPFGVTKESPCIFEYIYFARPDSSVFGRNVYPIRKGLGMELAKEHPVEADLVIPVPDSGVPAAIGYAQQSNIPFEFGIIRNHYVGRTFIEPQQSIRDFGVKLKLNANSDLLKDKRLIVVDDSLVRGTTSRKLVYMLRQAGAKEVHLRISCPPTTDPCYYGIDTPEKKELIASQNDVEQIQEFLGVDSLAYLSIEGLYKAVSYNIAGNPSKQPCKASFCDACFTGEYPVQIGKKGSSRQTKLFDG